MHRLVEARHIEIEVWQGGRDRGERAAAPARFERHLAAEAPQEGRRLPDRRFERRQQSEVAHECESSLGEVRFLATEIRRIERSADPHMMGKAALAARIDEHRRGTRGE